MRRTLMTWLTLALVVAATPALASFAGTDVVVPSVGRGGGAANSNWYTTLWVHNPTRGAVQVQVFLLERASSNPAPLVYNDTIPSGDTRRWTNAIETLFGVARFGALRVVASANVVVNARVYSQPSGGGEEDTTGQFFAGVPASFAIASGHGTQLLGTYQTQPAADSDYRYNYGFVETAGGSVTVRVTARDETGALLSSKEYALGARGMAQFAFKDEFPGVSTTNARLAVEVLSGSGAIVAFGSGIANRSNDPSTFEMQFADSLLGGSGSGDITAVTAGAGLTGGGTSGEVTVAVGAEAITGGMIATGAVGGSELADGTVASADIANEAITSADLANGAVTAAKVSTSGGTAGQVLTVGAAGAAWQTMSSGSGGDIAAVTAGAGLTGGGTSGDVTLAVGAEAITGGMIATGAVGSSELADGTVGATDLANGAVTKNKLAAGGGSNGQVLGTDGTNLVWQAPGGGSLTLPYYGPGSSGSDLFRLVNSGTGTVIKVVGSSGNGVFAETTTGAALRGTSTSNDGVAGITSTASGVWGGSTGASGWGVTGNNAASNFTGRLGGSSFAVYGTNGNSNSDGYAGYFSGRVRITQGLDVDRSIEAAGIISELAGAGVAVSGVANGVAGTGLYGVSGSGTSARGVTGISADGKAGYFVGDVQVVGTLSKSSGSFKIDHPLDPANRYLYHSFVESPDMMNIYNGNVTTDERGSATVELPEWFEALNRDFRYQLTVIGDGDVWAQARVARKIAGNAFVVQTSVPGIEVSWQVTGIRQDAFAEAHRIPVEEAKPDEERGYFLTPEVFGAPEERGVDWVHHADEMRRATQAREAAATASSERDD